MTTREGGRDREQEYGAGQLIVIPKNVPHIFHFLNQTVMAEWWTEPFETRYYTPYRSIVEHSLRAMRESRRLHLGKRSESMGPRLKPVNLRKAKTERRGWEVH